MITRGSERFYPWTPGPRTIVQFTGHVSESELDIMRCKRRAIVPFDILAQMKSIGLAIIWNFPAVRQFRVRSETIIKRGKLVIDVMGKEVLSRIFQERDWHEDNGKIFLRESKISRSWSWCKNRWMMLENGGLREFEFGHRIYSAAELSGLLTDCGFSSVNIYGSLDGADYDHNAKRLIAVAEK